MKKSLQLLTLSLSMALVSASTQAQTTVFDWDVDNAFTVQAVDQGTFNINYYDEDGLTPDPNTGLAPGSFDPNDDGSGSNDVLWATSWFSPAAQADNWVVFGPITMPANVTSSTITWDHAILDDNFRDGYEVAVSSAGPAPANFNGAALIASFTDNDPTTAGQNTLTGQSANIPTSFNGSQIYIAFHHNANDQFVLFLDNFTVTQTLAAAQTPVADFSGDVLSINPGGAVNFTDLSTNIPTSWSWTFTGASTTSSTDQNPTNIVYPTAGCYDVTLTSINSAGSDTETKTCYIDVVNPASPPVTDFTSNVVTVALGDPVNFTDLTSNAPTSWDWTFTGADVTSSTDQNPSGITYSNVGCYEVQLVATNSAGSDSEVKNCYIDVTCPNFDVGFAYTATSFNVQFTNNSVFCESYDWDFGDGNFSTATDPAHTYGGAGTYIVTLVGYDTDCTQLSGVDMYAIDIAFGSNNSNVGIADLTQIFDMNIYPNPSSGLFTLDFDVNTSEEVAVKVYNSVGQEVSNQNYGSVKGKFTSNIDLTDRESGVYLMQVTVGNNSQTRTIIVE